MGPSSCRPPPHSELRSARNEHEQEKRRRFVIVGHRLLRRWRRLRALKFLGGQRVPGAPVAVFRGESRGAGATGRSVDVTSANLRTINRSSAQSRELLLTSGVVATHLSRNKANLVAEHPVPLMESHGSSLESPSNPSDAGVPPGSADIPRALWFLPFPARAATGQSALASYRETQAGKKDHRDHPNPRRPALHRHHGHRLHRSQGRSCRRHPQYPLCRCRHERRCRPFLRVLRSRKLAEPSRTPACCRRASTACSALSRFAAHGGVAPPMPSPALNGGEPQALAMAQAAIHARFSCPSASTSIHSRDQLRAN